MYEMASNMRMGRRARMRQAFKGVLESIYEMDALVLSSAFGGGIEPKNERPEAIWLPKDG